MWSLDLPTCLPCLAFCFLLALSLSLSLSLSLVPRSFLIKEFSVLVILDGRLICYLDVGRQVLQTSFSIQFDVKSSSSPAGTTAACHPQFGESTQQLQWMHKTWSNDVELDFDIP